MTATLRPMSLGEILDRTFQIYRAKFLLFVGIAALPALASAALGAVLFLLGKYAPDTTLSASSLDSLREFSSWLPNQWPYAFFHYLVWPFFILMASGIFLGEKQSFTAARRSCVARWKSWLALAGILWATRTLLPHVLNRLVFNHMMAATNRSMIGLNGGRSSYLFAELMIELLRWALDFLLIALVVFSVPVWALEGMKAGAALKRSWTFAKHNCARLLVAWLLVNVLNSVLSFTFAGIFFALRSAAGSSFLGRYYLSPFDFLVPLEWAIYAFVAPLLPIAVTLIYYDQRIRQEGYDIERMMDAAGMDTSVTVPATAEEAQA